MNDQNHPGMNQKSDQVSNKLGGGCDRAKGNGKSKDDMETSVSPDGKASVERIRSRFGAKSVQPASRVRSPLKYLFLLLDILL